MSETACDECGGGVLVGHNRGCSKEYPLRCAFPDCDATIRTNDETKLGADYWVQGYYSGRWYCPAHGDDNSLILAGDHYTQ